MAKHVYNTEWTHYKCVVCGGVFEESLGKYGCCSRAAKPILPKPRTLEQDIFGLSKNTNTINSKVKGNSNERACAKALGDYVGVKFARVFQSGAIRKVNTEGVIADIAPDTIDNNFVWDWIVETKALKELKVKRFLSASSRLFSIWEQPYSDAIRGNKLPMALIRTRGMPAGEYYLILEASQGGTVMAANTPIAFSGSNGKHSLIGFMFSDVKKHTPYTQFAKAIKRLNIVSKSKLFIQD